MNLAVVEHALELLAACMLCESEACWLARIYVYFTGVIVLFLANHDLLGNSPKLSFAPELIEKRDLLCSNVGGVVLHILVRGQISHQLFRLPELFETSCIDSRLLPLHILQLVLVCDDTR